MQKVLLSEVSGVPNAGWEDKQVNVDINSPSCAYISYTKTRSNNLFAYSFNLGQLSAGVQVRQQSIFSQSCCEYAPSLIESDATTSINWLYSIFWLESRLKWGLIRHCTVLTWTASRSDSLRVRCPRIQEIFLR
jgi:hypothetical protein